MASMTLADRFQAVTKAQHTEEFMNKSYDELSRMTIAFGEAKVGQTYLEVIEKNPKYVQWFTKKYAESPKITHKSFLFFINLYVERKELMMDHVTSTQGPTPKAMALKPKSKAMPTAVSEAEGLGSWSEDDVEWEEESQTSHQMVSEVNQQGQRISAIEDSLAVITHQLQSLLQLASVSAPAKP
jgi:hypothetical protein